MFQSIYFHSFFFTRCFEIDMRVDWYFDENPKKKMYIKFCFVGGFFLPWIRGVFDVFIF